MKSRSCDKFANAEQFHKEETNHSTLQGYTNTLFPKKSDSVVGTHEGLQLFIFSRLEQHIRFLTLSVF